MQKPILMHRSLIESNCLSWETLNPASSAGDKRTRFMGLLKNLRDQVTTIVSEMSFLTTLCRNSYRRRFGAVGNSAFNVIAYGDRSINGDHLKLSVIWQ